MREVAPLYRQFERGGAISLIYFVQKYAECWLEFHFMVHDQPGGQVVKIEIFYRCNLIGRSQEIPDDV